MLLRLKVVEVGVAVGRDSPGALKWFRVPGAAGAAFKGRAMGDQEQVNGGTDHHFRV